jgi:hypothetical protein
MAIDFDTAAPTVAKAPIKRVVTRTAKDRAPNPFVTKGWLLASKERTAEYDFAAEGVFVAYEKKVRATGEVVKALKVTGDAYAVAQLIRQAAEELGIGVRIEFYGAKGAAVKSGKISGVRYLGTKRKESKKNDATVTEVVTSA